MTKLIKKVMKEPFVALLISIIIITIIIRFLRLNILPPGMAPDEMDMVLSSKAIAETGKDISGVPFPLFFVKSWTGARQTNVIPFLLSPYFRLITPNLLTSRLPFLLINLLAGLGIVKIVRIFNKEKLLSLTFFFVFLVNPWAFVYSRVTFAAPVSLMFFVWGIYFLLKGGKNLLYSYVFLFLSTLCYLGALFLIPPLVAALSIYEILKQKGNLKKRIIYLSSYILFVGLFVLTSLLTKDGTIGRRTEELSINSVGNFSQNVNETRRSTMEFTGKIFVINKYTLFAINLAKNYINVFNPNSLFFEGDPGFNFAFAGHGLFYIIDFFLIVVGLATLTKQKKELATIILIMALLSPLGAAASNVTYTFIYRAFPMVFVLLTLTSFGLWTVFKTPIKLIALVIYLLFFANFLFYYMLQFPVQAGEKFNVSERIAVNIAVREEQMGKKVKIIDYFPYSVVNRISIYSYRGINYTTPRQNYFNLGNITISNKCDFENADVVVVDEKVECRFPGDDYVVIQQQKDAGYRYKIYGDSFCNKESLNTYKRFHLINDYKIEKLDNSTFCSRWIFKPI